jgi:IclR family KDG regulon transcriptional repressor
MGKDSVSWDKNEVGAVAKALWLIRHVGMHGPCTLNQLVEAIDMPRSTVHRLLATVAAADFLNRRPDGTYVVSPAVWGIAAAGMSPMVLESEIHSALQGLVDATHETAHYSVYDDGMAVYVQKIDGLHPVRAYTWVGGRSPAYASATGKALLSMVSNAEIERVAAQAVKLSDTTIVGARAVMKEIDAIRECGYAVNRGEWRAGVWGVASPLVDRFGALAGAIGVSGPQERIEPSVDSYAELVRNAATALTIRHGGTAADAKSVA